MNKAEVNSDISGTLCDITVDGYNGDARVDAMGMLGLK